MPTERHLFLDLEDTVIEPVPFGWANPSFINRGKTKEFIAEFRPDQVHIFSFAVRNDFDVRAFDLHVRDRLEQHLGIKLTMVPSTDQDIFPAICKLVRLSPSRVEFSDISAFWGKHESFRLFVRHLFAGKHPVEVALLDDAVLTEKFEWPELGITGHLVNIDQL